MVKQLQTIMDRVLVRLDEGKAQTSGGVLLTDNTDKKRTTGVVESIGEQVKSVKIGDRVLFHVFDELPTLDNDLVVVRERSLLGIFSDL